MAVDVASQLAQWVCGLAARVRGCCWTCCEVLAEIVLYRLCWVLAMIWSVLHSVGSVAVCSLWAIGDAVAEVDAAAERWRREAERREAAKAEAGRLHCLWKEAETARRRWAERDILGNAHGVRHQYCPALF